MDFNEYQKSAMSTAIFPNGGTPLALMYCALKLNGEAGELAEHVGKALRDDDLMNVTEFNGKAVTFNVNPLTEDRETLIKKEVGDVLWYLAAICDYFDIDMNDVAQQNIDKLASRHKKGTLQGSGDNR